MFIVNYEADDGKMKAFGTFSLLLDAILWMKSQVDCRIENAKKNGIDLKVLSMNDGLTMKIENSGTWTVVGLTPVSH